MSQYSEGQTHQLMDALEDAGFTAEHITKLGQYKNLSGFRLVLDGEAELRMIAKDKTTAKEIKTYLRRLSVFKLGATDGTDTYDTAKEVFKAGFNADFKNFGIVFSGVEPEINVASDELVLDGEFRDFLGNTAAELEKRRLRGSQFLKLCREHSDKLLQEGYASFVVLTKNDEGVAEDLSNVFVARVYVFGGGRLDAGVRRFSRDGVWGGGSGLRFFFLQQ